MNFNPQNEESILGLVAALKGGMDPSAAFSVLGSIEQDQAAQIAQRQQRLSGLAELLMGAAQSGMSYQGAEALAGAAPGPMGPAVEAMMSSLYPTADAAPPTNASGAVMDFPAGNRPTPSGLTPPTPQGMQYPTAGPDLGTGQQAVSPVFQPPQPSVSEQMAVAEMEQQQAITADLTAMQADAAARKAEGWTLEQFLAAAQKNNPTLFAAAPEQVQAILMNTFGEMAFKTMGVQPSV